MRRFNILHLARLTRSDDASRCSWSSRRSSRRARSSTTRSAAAAAGPSAEADDSDDSNLCVVCLDGARAYVAVPCGHKALCGNCAPCFEGGRKECPLCRHTVKQKIRVYE